MTKDRKVRVLYVMLLWAPMVESTPNFRKYAEADDFDSFWEYYQNSIRSRQDIKRSVEAAGEVSFEMLRPAMEAVFDLPTNG